jgi:predicted DNA binding CopG/RHH family protein
MTDQPETTEMKEFRITVRITEAELQALKQEAEQQGTTVGAALRLLIQDLKKQPGGDH